MFPPIHCCPPPHPSTPRDPRRARERRRRGQGRRRAMQSARSRCTCPAPALLSCPMTSPPRDHRFVCVGGGGVKLPKNVNIATTSSGSLTWVSNFLINPGIFKKPFPSRQWDTLVVLFWGTTLPPFITVSTPVVFQTSNLYLGWLQKRFIRGKYKVLPGFEPGNPEHDLFIFQKRVTICGYSLTLSLRYTFNMADGGHLAENLW